MVKPISGGGFAEDVGKSFDQVMVGSKIPVTYQPDDPSNSCMGEPETTFYPNIRLTIFACLIPTIALFLLGAYYFKRSDEPGAG